MTVFNIMRCKRYATGGKHLAVISKLLVSFYSEESIAGIGIRTFGIGIYFLNTKLYS
jgi:hypothetical protein